MGAEFTPAFLAWMRVQSTKCSPKKCRDKGVGGMITELRKMVPDNGVGPFISGAREDLQLCESFCRLCKRCPGPD